MQRMYFVAPSGEQELTKKIIKLTPCCFS